MTHNIFLEDEIQRRLLETALCVDLPCVNVVEILRVSQLADKKNEKVRLVFVLAMYIKSSSNKVYF